MQRYYNGNMKNYVGNKILAILLGMVALIFIGSTLYLLLGNTTYYKNSQSESIQASQATTTNSEGKTTSVTTGYSSTTFPRVESVVQKKLTLSDGVVREVRNEVSVKEWRHPSGTIVTLYEKDYFYFPEDSRWSDEGKPLKQDILRSTHNGKTFDLIVTPDNEGNSISSLSRDNVAFSPLGTYFTIYVGGYESSSYDTFDLNTGKEIQYGKDGYENKSNQLFWSSDERKLLIIRGASSMDGTRPRIAFSKTGSVADLVDVGDLDKKYLTCTMEDWGEACRYSYDLSFTEIHSDGKNVMFLMNQYDNYGSNQNLAIPVMFDFSTETIDFKTNQARNLP